MRVVKVLFGVFVLLLIIGLVAADEGSNQSTSSGTNSSEQYPQSNLSTNSSVPSPGCTDSDGGRDYYVKGTVQGWEAGLSSTATDFCDGDTLREFFCGINPIGNRWNYNWEDYNCQYGCEDGACRTTPAPPEEPENISGCGRLIYFGADDCSYCKLTDPRVDKYAEDSGCVEVVKHILPNLMNPERDKLTKKYGVNGFPTFLFVKGDCFEKFGSGGTTTIEDIKNGISNSKCNNPIENNTQENTSTSPACPVYTCDGGYAPKCEIKDGRCACETCPAILLPNATTGPVEIPASATNSTATGAPNYFCSGCDSDKKCYPIGYRKSGEYCNDMGSFSNQSSIDSACENNFECSSNVCVNSQCISEGLMQKILNWFKHLFGG